MIQDILPHNYDIGFRPRAPRDDDFWLAFNNGRVLLARRPDQPALIEFGQARRTYPQAGQPPIYLFSIDELGIFLSPDELPEAGDFIYEDVQVFRAFQPSWLAFAGVTASHLAAWYAKNRFCGRCSRPMIPSPTERAMNCPACGLVNYPSISPAVIVGVIDGDRMLLTRYAGRQYRNLALIAGFMEVGETPEDTVRREVKEEVGLKVRNIRYYKSQPWAFTQSLLLGFFADLDGSPEIVLDQNELSEGVWLPRSEMPLESLPISLTYEMIDVFRRGEVPAC